VVLTHCVMCLSTRTPTLPPPPPFHTRTYTQHPSTPLTTHAVLFNVFDVSGSGLISKKEFSSMAQAVIVGGRTLSWDRHTGRPADSAGTVGFEFFKPMADMMVEMAMLEARVHLERGSGGNGVAGMWGPCSKGALCPVLWPWGRLDSPMPNSSHPSSLSPLPTLCGTARSPTHPHLRHAH
jgi:hypothetical protein